jgi:hypothetical protein
VDFLAWALKGFWIVDVAVFGDSIDTRVDSVERLAMVVCIAGEVEGLKSQKAVFCPFHNDAM